MKNLIFLSMFLLLSCDDNIEVDPILEIVGETSVSFTNALASSTIIVETNVADWTVSVAESGEGWCTVRRLNSGTVQRFAIDVTSNSEFEKRETEVIVAANNLQRRLNVTQLGLEPSLTSDRIEYTVAAAGGIVAINVIANVPFDTLFQEPWIRPVEPQTESAPPNYLVVFEVELNDDAQQRTAEITFSYPDKELSRTVRIVQAGRSTDFIPGDPNEFGEDTKISVISSQASNSQASEPIGRSHDGDMTTLYHSNWNNTVFPVTLTWNFSSNADALDYLIYYPRTDGVNGRIHEVEIFVSTAEVTAFQSIGTFNFHGSGSPSTVSFPGGVVRPRAVRFIVRSGEGGFVSVAEIEFYKRNQTNTIDRTIFADDIASKLQPGVTREMIEDMQNVFMSNIALTLYRDEYPSEFRVQSYKPYPHPGIRAAADITWPYSLLDNPTGIALQAGTECIVFVGETQGQSISLRVMDYSTMNREWTGSTFPLSEGINKLKIDRSGLAYVIYHTADPQAKPIDIHIASGQVNGYFDMSKHSRNDWNRLLNAAPHRHFDAVGLKSHLVFPTADFRQRTPDGTRLLEVYDSIVWLQQRFMGLYKYDRVPGNRMFFHVTHNNDEPGIAYATPNRTCYKMGMVPEILTASILRTTGLWGPAHEVGHMHQTRPNMTFRWAGQGEVSVNVFSLYVQWHMGNVSRLQAQTPINTYETAFVQIIGQRQLHMPHTDLFRLLVPFWQLELYMSRVRGYTDFYADLYEKFRTTPNPANDGAAQVNFVKLCSEVAQLDMTEFFDAWGMLTPMNAVAVGTTTVNLTQAQINTVKNDISQYQKPQHAFQYIQDNNVNLFLNNAMIGKGTVSRNGNSVNINSWTNVVAVEQYNSDNQMVAATSLRAFTLHAETAKAYAVGATGERIEIEY